MIRTNVLCVKYISGSASETMDTGLKLKGRVKENGAPVPCSLRLFEQGTGTLVAIKASNVNGEFEFSHLKAVKFFIVAQHPDNLFPAVIQDNAVPK